MTFKFNQAVETPKGRAVFIGYLEDGNECQISLRILRDGKNIVVNKIYPVGEITELKETHQRKPRRAPVSQAADVAIE